MCLRSARLRHEDYVGPWLPDPVTDTAVLAPDAQTELTEDLSVALMLALDRLSPLERASFLLRDVFDYSFTQVADALGRNEAACRQLPSPERACARLAAGWCGSTARRIELRGPAACRTALGFHHRVALGRRREVDASAGHRCASHHRRGGKVPAALNVIDGADRVAMFLAGVASKGWTDERTVGFNTIIGHRPSACSA